jgi:hypothetical protein
MSSHGPALLRLIASPLPFATRSGLASRALAAASRQSSALGRLSAAPEVQCALARGATLFDDRATFVAAVLVRGVDA